jgi:hypothetical protein
MKEAESLVIRQHSDWMRRSEYSQWSWCDIVPSLLASAGFSLAKAMLMRSADDFRQLLVQITHDMIDQIPYRIHTENNSTLRISFFADDWIRLHRQRAWVFLAPNEWVGPTLPPGPAYAGEMEASAFQNYYHEEDDCGRKRTLQRWSTS